jgi:hypothetical protein
MLNHPTHEMGSDGSCRYCGAMDLAMCMEPCTKGPFDTRSGAHPYPYGSITFAGSCSSCGARHELTIAHPSRHTRISGTEREVHCYAQGRISCNSQPVLLTVSK